SSGPSAADVVPTVDPSASTGNGIDQGNGKAAPIKAFRGDRPPFGPRAAGVSRPLVSSASSTAVPVGTATTTAVGQNSAPFGVGQQQQQRPPGVGRGGRQHDGDNHNEPS